VEGGVLAHMIGDTLASSSCHCEARPPLVIARSSSDEAISCPTEIATPSARNDGLVAISLQPLANH